MTATAPRVEQQHDGITLQGVSWDTYERLRSDLYDAGSHVKIVYDDGTMAVLAPVALRQRQKKLVARMVDVTSYLLGVPIASFGSATWKRSDLRRALEPDEMYYVRHEPQMGRRRVIDPRSDPPPDLVVEVNTDPWPLDVLAVYASLGMPEVWHVEGDHVRCLRLTDAGRYVDAETSLAFPFLRPAHLNRFLSMLPGKTEHEMIREFADWVRTLST